MLLQLLEGLGLNPDQPWVVVHSGAIGTFSPVSAGTVRGGGAIAHGPGHHSPFHRYCTRTSPGGQPRSQLGATSHSLVGRLNLSELSALLAAAPLLLSKQHRTRPHRRRNWGLRWVDLYALTQPAAHPPWQVPHRVLYHDVPPPAASATKASVRKATTTACELLEPPGCS